jgi:hypothetical protein
VPKATGRSGGLKFVKTSFLFTTCKENQHVCLYL